jgi:hypothetical protein
LIHWLKLQVPCAARPIFPSNLLNGGAEGIRTHDPHNAIVVLYQLSYDPIQIGSQSKLPA